MINGVVFIYFKIIKDDLSPALGKIKFNLNSNRFATAIFSPTKYALIRKADNKDVTPRKTGDLLESIVSSPSVFGRGSDFIAMDFGARGGDDPKFHTDPANYAWKVGGQGIDSDEIGYFSRIFSEARTEFLTMSRVSYGDLLNKYSYY